MCIVCAHGPQHDFLQRQSYYLGKGKETLIKPSQIELSYVNGTLSLCHPFISTHTFSFSQEKPRIKIQKMYLRSLYVHVHESTM